MKNKIAFVVIRYGKDVNGGAEQHCRMLAEKLCEKYDVEVLTTCVKNYRTGGNEFHAGTETINGVLVRRFLSDITDIKEEKPYAKKAKPARRIRHFLYRAGILHIIATVLPIWRLGMKKDINALKHSIFYSSDMVSFIRENKDKYKAFIPLTADYAPFYFTAVEAGEKAIAIPTLHEAKVSFRPALTEAFSKFRYVGFNTGAEQRLGKEIFGKAIGDSGIIGCGIETKTASKWENVKNKFGLPDRYLLYIGRIDKSKTGKILNYYKAYRKKYPEEAASLVMTGGIYDMPKCSEGIILTGFVTDEEKRSIMQNALALINPSYYESLSLVVLEALNEGIPALVNGKCAVLKEHCIRSGGAVKYYTGSHGFIKQIRKISSSASLRQEMASKGKEYFNKNYSWDIIIDRISESIENMPDKNAFQSQL